MVYVLRTIGGLLLPLGFVGLVMGIRGDDNSAAAGGFLIAILSVFLLAIGSGLQSLNQIEWNTRARDSHNSDKNVYPGTASTQG